MEGGCSLSFSVSCLDRRGHYNSLQLTGDGPKKTTIIFSPGADLGFIKAKKVVIRDIRFVASHSKISCLSISDPAEAFIRNCEFIGIGDGDTKCYMGIIVSSRAPILFEKCVFLCYEYAVYGYLGLTNMVFVDNCFLFCKTGVHNSINVIGRSPSIIGNQFIDVNGKISAGGEEEKISLFIAEGNEEYSGLRGNLIQFILKRGWLHEATQIKIPEVFDLQREIAAANSGEEILIPAGMHVLKDSISISMPLKIKGAGKDKTIIVLESGNLSFIKSSHIEISDLKIRFETEFGVGIFIGAQTEAIINNCSFHSRTSENSDGGTGIIVQSELPITINASEFINFEVAIEAQETANGEISNCFFWQSKVADINLADHTRFAVKKNRCSCNLVKSIVVSSDAPCNLEENKETSE